jgi:hypothetical protein
MEKVQFWGLDAARSSFPNLLTKEELAKAEELEVERLRRVKQWDLAHPDQVSESTKKSV